jgi:hypothetical protein
MKLHDSTIVLIDIFGCLCKTLIVAFASAEWMLYVGLAVAVLDSTSYSMMRCIVSKYVEPNEVGRLFGMLSAMLAFVPLVASPIYGNIYRSTVESFPQAFLLVNVGLFGVYWLTMFFVNRRLRRIDKIRLRLHEEKKVTR